MNINWEFVGSLFKEGGSANIRIAEEYIQAEAVKPRRPQRVVQGRKWLYKEQKWLYEEQKGIRTASGNIVLEPVKTHRTAGRRGLLQKPAFVSSAVLRNRRAAERLVQEDAAVRETHRLEEEVSHLTGIDLHPQVTAFTNPFKKQE